MENRKILKYIIPLLAGLFFIFSGTAMAYGPETHAYLTDEAINFFNQKTGGVRVPPDLKAFIIDGSSREDDIPRFLNHFYDPVYNRGLETDYSITPFIPIGSWESAKDWADDSVNQNKPIYKVPATIGSILTVIEQRKISAISSETNFTWSRAIDFYAEGKNEEAMFTLGHVLHLIEDMSVPDHTRNDAHAEGSPYELYADRFILGKPDSSLSLKLASKSLINSENLDQAFDGLATYSNNNFYSDDTIGIQSGYNLPQPDYFLPAGKYSIAIKTDPINGNYKLFLKDSNVLDTVAVNKNKIFLFLQEDNGDQVMKDYWSHLSPKSVQYTASVIDLFFKEAEAARKEYNASPPVIEEEKSLFGQIMDGIGSWLLGLTDAAREAWLRMFGDQPEIIGEFPLNPQTPIKEEAIDQYKEKPLISVAKLRIARGETNQIQGSRFSFGGKVTISIERPDKIRIEVPVVSDNSGRIVYQYKPAAYDPIGVYYISAKDTVSGLTSDRIKFELAEAVEKIEEEETSNEVEETENNKPEDDLRFCDFGSSSYGSGQVILNEIAWMGSSASANSEWIELKNVSTGTVDLSGWQILDKDKGIKIRFPAGAKISAGSFYLLERTTDASVPGVAADAIYTGALSNSGEDLKLFNASCGLVDAVFSSDGWLAGDAASRKTMEKDSSGIGWHTSSFADGTPKQENSTGSYTPPLPPPVTPPSPSPTLVDFCDQFDLDSPTRKILINEIAWAGSIVSSSDEWIELKNIGDTDISLKGWQLLDKAGDIKIVFPGSTAIPAHGFYLLERTDDESVPGVAANLVYIGGLNNSEETLRLFDNECALVDEVIDVGENWSNIGGSGAPDYRTAERTNLASWHTYHGEGIIGIKGTPKAENSVPAAEEESDALAADDWQISYNFDEVSVDFSLPINEDVSYRILDMESGKFTDVILNASGVFSKRIDEIGRNYQYRIRIKGEDGTDLGYSDIKTIYIPSYIENTSFYRASHYTLRGEEIEEPLFEFSYDNYPFMPRDTNLALAYGEPPGPNYKVMVFYLNRDAPKDLFLNVDQPLAKYASDVLKTRYDLCGGITESERSSIVLADAAEGCNIMIGGIPNSAMVFQTYLSEEDNRLLLPIKRQSGETVFDSEDFITVAFYGLYRFYPSSHQETDIFKLLAVDKQKYYFGEAPEHLAPIMSGEIAASFDALKSELTWSVSPGTDPDSLDPLLRYEISYDAGATWENGSLENKKTTSPGESHSLWIRANDDFGIRSEPLRLEYVVPESQAPFGISNISWREIGGKKILNFDYPQYPFIPGETGFKAMVFYFDRLPPESYNGGYTGGNYPRIQTKHLACAGFDPVSGTGILRDFPILILADSSDLVRDSFGGEVTEPNKCFDWTSLPRSAALVPVPGTEAGRISLEISGLLDSDRSLNSLNSSDFFTIGFYKFDLWGNGIMVANDTHKYYFSP